MPTRVIYGVPGSITSGTGSVINLGTITTATKALDIIATWNNAAQLFDMVTAEITDTASDASSRLLDLLVGGVSKFRVLKDGTLSLASSTKVVNLNADLLDSADTTTVGGVNAIPILDGSGRLRLGADPSNVLDAASKQYIDVTRAPTLTEKKGSGVGNYTTTSASYADVDGTNLAYATTVATGWKALVTFVAAVSTSAGGNQGIAITDGTTVLKEQIFSISTSAVSVALSHTFAGDGASHTFKARWSTSAGTATMYNATATQLPVLTIMLTPSN